MFIGSVRRQRICSLHRSHKFTGGKRQNRIKSCHSSNPGSWVWRQPTDVFPGPHSSLGDVLAVEAKLCGSRGSLLQGARERHRGPRSSGRGGSLAIQEEAVRVRTGLSGSGFWKSSRTSKMFRKVVFCTELFGTRCCPVRQPVWLCAERCKFRQ